MLNLMARYALPLILAILLVAACGGDDGGDDDAVLHLRGFDATESNYRLGLKASKLENLIGFGLTCTTIEGLSPQEAAEVLAAAADPDQEVSPIWERFGTLKPGQVSDEPSRVRATEILLDECE